MKPSDQSRKPPRPTSVSRPLFSDKAEFARFMQDFSGQPLKAAAPVQADPFGWQNYLSRRELKQYNRARGISSNSAAIAIGTTVLNVAGALMLTASMVPLMGAVSATAGAIAIAHWGEAVRIRRRGKRRENDADASARHPKAPQVQL